MEFEKIDDFSRYLNLKDGEAIGRAFQHLVNRHFDFIEKEDGTFEKNEDDLLLCFLEMVTLVEKDVIGETILRSHFKKNRVKTFIETYKKIVEAVKSDPACIDSISGYKNWYTMGTFLLTVANPDAVQPMYTIKSSWDGQPPETMKDLTRQRKLYAIDKGDILEQDIKTYLSHYYKLLSDQLDFGDYPHVCVIVRPISVTDGENLIPIGNLYLHFATRTKKTEQFYLRFINDFIRVWYNEKGYEIITKIKKFAVSEALENEEKIPMDFIPHFSKYKIGKLHNKNLANDASLFDYFEKLYLDLVERNKFQLQLYKITEKVIELYFEICRAEEEGSGLITPFFVEIRKTFLMQRIAALQREYSLESFKNILFYREIFKIGVLLFDFDPMRLHYDLTSKLGYDPSCHNKINNLSNALWSERLIPCPKRDLYSPQVIINDIRLCLSPVEKKYMERYEVIKHKLEPHD